MPNRGGGLSGKVEGLEIGGSPQQSFCGVKIPFKTYTSPSPSKERGTKGVR